MTRKELIYLVWYIYKRTNFLVELYNGDLMAVFWAFCNLLHRIQMYEKIDDN